MKSKTIIVRGIGAIMSPILFALFGYFVSYMIGKPVVDFVTSSVELILLSKEPEFGTELELGNIEAIKPPEQNVDIIKASEFEYPSEGTQYGIITVEHLRLEAPLFSGDTDAILRIGSGMYRGSPYPGQLGGTLIGGHNTDEFGKFGSLQIGDEILLTLTYGTYIYEVIDMQVKRYDDPTAIELMTDRTKRSIILYTCYPLDMLGSTDDRLFVYGNLISGPIIEEEN